MKIRLAFMVFCITACLTVLFTTPVHAAACQDLNEQIHEHMSKLEEIDREKEELRIQIQQADDPAQIENIEVRIEEIERERDALRETLGALEREFSECESQPDQDGDHDPKPQLDANRDDGLSPLIIAAIISACGVALAALIGLLRRK
jgi:septal ring factor EnvC (AmiA/AmiB activator)